MRYHVTGNAPKGRHGSLDIEADSESAARDTALLRGWEIESIIPAVSAQAPTIAPTPRPTRPPQYPGLQILGNVFRVSSGIVAAALVIGLALGSQSRPSGLDAMTTAALIAGAILALIGWATGEAILALRDIARNSWPRV